MKRECGTLFRVFNEHEDQLRDLCRRAYRLRPDDGEEVLQLTRIALVRLDAKSYTARDPWKFIRAVLRRQVLVLLRADRRAHRPFASVSAMVNAEAAHDAQGKERLQSVLLAVARLSALLRDAFLARDVLQLSEAESARVLGTNTPTMATRLKRAREEIREECATPPNLLWTRRRPTLPYALPLSAPLPSGTRHKNWASCSAIRSLTSPACSNRDQNPAAQEPARWTGSPVAGAAAEISLLLLSLMGPSQSAVTTQQSEVETGASIIEAVARYAYENRQYATRNDKLMPSIKVDPRVVAKMGFMANVDNSQEHSSLVTNKLRTVRGVSVVSAERADRCAAWAPSDCMDAGKSIVIAFARPEVKGDSATVEMYVRVSGQVSAADSASLITKSKFSLSLRRAGIGVDRATLKRINGQWVVRITALVRT